MKTESSKGVYKFGGGERRPSKGDSDALLLKLMPEKQIGFVLLLKQNKLDLVFHHQN